MATILQSPDQTPILQKEVKQSDLDSLQKRLDMAEASRCVAQNDYQEMRVKYQQLNQEKEMLEHMLVEKTSVLKSEMTVWIKSKTILKYFDGHWLEKMGLKLNHEGLITGFVYAND